MNEERTGKCLHQVEHIRCHLRYRYSRMVNKVMVETVKFSKWWFQRNPLSRKSWEEPQALEYHINWDIYSISSCVLCTQCCQCLCIVHSWLPIRFSMRVYFLYIPLVMLLWPISLLLYSFFLMWNIKGNWNCQLFNLSFHYYVRW